MARSCWGPLHQRGQNGSRDSEAQTSIEPYQAPESTIFQFKGRLKWNFTRFLTVVAKLRYLE